MKYIKFPIEESRYLTNCLANRNRAWIEPHMYAIEQAYKDGKSDGESEGYQKGLKENKIIFPNQP